MKKILLYGAALLGIFFILSPFLLHSANFVWSLLGSFLLFWALMQIHSTSAQKPVWKLLTIIAFILLLGLIVLLVYLAGSALSS